MLPSFGGFSCLIAGRSHQRETFVTTVMGL